MSTLSVHHELHPGRGAIDVIVIQRPTGDGDTELACSPFHVRFGKWQVLRPGEKKVRDFEVHYRLQSDAPV